MVIWFNSEKARRQLIDMDEVITCRKRRKTFGITSAIYKRKDGDIETIAKVNVQLLIDSIDVHRQHYRPFSEYVELSGFESVEEWKEEIKKLNKNRWMPEYLIFLKVTVVDQYGS